MLRPDSKHDRKFSVGGTTLRQALQQASGWDAETLSQCYIEVGDTGETISLLMQDVAAGEPMTLGDAEILYARLYKQKRTVDKIEMLRQIYLRYKPATLKFFVKAITGNLRIGLQAKMVEEAIAEATGTPLEDVRMANNRVSDLPLVAVAARRNRLDEIEARLFHPMEFMLAKPLDSVDGLTDPENWWVEDKYDGFRSQVHAEQRSRANFYPRNGGGYASVSRNRGRLHASGRSGSHRRGDPRLARRPSPPV